MLPPCTNPPPLTETDLNAALDDTASPVVLDHLARCPSCAARLARARRAEQRLKTVLYRVDCPAPHEIGEYLLDHLPASAAQVIGAHLQTCPRCQDELDQLRRFLRGGAPAQSGSTPTSRSGSRRDRTLRAVPRTAAAVRGEQASMHIVEAEGVTLFFEQDPQTQRLNLQLAADMPEPWRGALVEIWQEGQLRASGILDDTGAFSTPIATSAPVTLRLVNLRGERLLLTNHPL